MTAVFSAFVLLGAFGASAGVLYSQPANNPGTYYASQNDTTLGGYGNFAIVYDDFTLAGASTVTTVDWTGGYYGGGGTPDITGFTVDFFSDNAGQPGALLVSDSVVGNAGQTLLGDGDFSYSAGAPFSAAGGTKYWLSIVPDMAFPPQWGWESSSPSGGDGIAYQYFLGNTSQVGTDFAFTLEGNASVPDGGSTAMLLGMGVAGLTWLRRRFVA